MAANKEKDYDGFFGKDEDFGTRLDRQYSQGEQFVILSMERDTPFVNPNDGQTIESRTKMQTRQFDGDTLKAYGLPVEVKTLSQVIFDRAALIMPDDFPAVCVWDKVPVEKWHNEALVIRKVMPYPVPDDVRQMLADSE